MIRKCILAALLAITTAGCVSQNSGTRNPGSPNYMQEGLGAPARQTDFFGNSLRP